MLLPFSEDNLALSLSNDCTSPEAIKNKSHFRYLSDYLTSHDISAKTIVIEEKYVSKDYLDDFTSYYSRCFKDYSKFCKRIHFFSITLDVEEFQKMVLSNETDSNKVFTESYLGFIVVKPIPLNTIGYTVLKTYNNGIGFNNRIFWGTRKYVVHCFGKKVKLKSLAFQEQDSVLAACATTAIWSMLNKAALDFHTVLKSPSQITIDADNVSPGGGRLFPNKGLDVAQICQSILNSGLVSELFYPEVITKISAELELNCVSNLTLKKIINGYSSIGIPIILVIWVPTGVSSYGLHAITVSGTFQSNPKPISPSKEIVMVAENIERLYAHDDQWGPFAKIQMQNDIELITPWTEHDSSHQPTFVNSIIVPAYPKVRISYFDIEEIVLGLNTILGICFMHVLKDGIVWDIKLKYSEDLKSEIRDSLLEDSEKFQLLSKSLPKYLWVASCYMGENKIIDFTFDATDVSIGMIGVDVLCYIDSELRKFIHESLVTNRGYLETLFNHRSKINYYDFLITKFS